MSDAVYGSEKISAQETCLIKPVRYLQDIGAWMENESISERIPRCSRRGPRATKKISFPKDRRFSAVYCGELQLSDYFSVYRYQLISFAFNYGIRIRVSSET
jgi:hypothetical protein